MSEARDADAHRECTRDPIFLFQRGRWIETGEPAGYVHDGEGWREEGEDGEPEEDADYLTNEQLRAMRCAKQVWETESVYLTREEGEAYGRARAYNYRDGWRVFCVCAEGALAALLREHA